MRIWLLSSSAMFLSLLLPSGPAAAAKVLKLSHDRVITIYKEYEIPKYLRADDCKQYAFKESVSTERLINDGSGDLEIPPEPGSLPEDRKAFERQHICLVSLLDTPRIKGEELPIEIHQVQPFNGSAATTHVSKNKKILRDGKYKLENDMTINVRNGLLFSSGSTP